MKFELEPDNRERPDTELLDDLRHVAKMLNKEYVTKDEYDKHGRWCSATFQKRFDSWTHAHELADLKKLKNYGVTEEDCLVDIKRVSELLGKTTFSSYEYEKHGKYNREMIRRRCGSWKATLKRLGFTPCTTGQRIPTEYLFENLEHLWESIGHQPSRKDFGKPLSKYCYAVYVNRFGGSYRKALEAFVASLDKSELDQPNQPSKQDVVESISASFSKRHKTPRSISWRMRFLVLRRDDFKCRICGSSPAMKPGTILVVDHIVPWDKGGETVMENLQTLCEACNGGKSNLSMEE
jgi:hypothetical protein